MVARLRLMLAVVIGACGGSQTAPPSNTEATTPPPADPAPSEPPTPIQRSDRQAVELALEIIVEMAEAAANSGGSCVQMGQALAPLAIANADLFIHLGAINTDPNRVGVLDRFRDGMENAMTELFAQIGDCGGDPGVVRAMEAMSG